MTESMQSETDGSPSAVTAPTSRVAALSNRVAIFGFVSAALAVMAVQGGIVTPLFAFGLFALGAIFGGFGGLLLGAIGLLLTRDGQDPAGRRNALTGGGIGLALMALVYVAALPGQGLPSINDITTDLDDPPKFATGTDAPDYGGRDMTYPEEFAVQVRAAYSDLASIRSDADASTSFDRAMATAKQLGWQITYSDANAGVFDAQERSAIFRFVDDITVRVRSDGDGTVIDVRSKSRDGRGDLGANAARIRRFSVGFEG